MWFHEFSYCSYANIYPLLQTKVKYFFFLEFFAHFELRP